MPETSAELILERCSNASRSMKSASSSATIRLQMELTMVTSVVVMVVVKVMVEAVTMALVSMEAAAKQKVDRFEPVRCRGKRGS